MPDTKKLKYDQKILEFILFIHLKKIPNLTKFGPKSDTHVN